MEKIKTVLIILIVSIIGAFYIYAGIKIKIQENENLGETDTAKGYFCDCELVSKKSKKENDTYILVYKYFVNDQEYRVKTNYSTNVVPKIGSEKLIQYSKLNPSNAKIKGFSSSTIASIAGIAPIVIAILSISVKKSENFNRVFFMFLIILIIAGIVLIILGIRQNVDTNTTMRNYKITKGESVRYYTFKEDTGKTKYRYIYRYTVDGKTYEVLDHNMTESMPHKMKKQIQYNKDNPEEAMVGGRVGNSMIFFAGIMLIVVPCIFSYSLLEWRFKEKNIFKAVNTNIIIGIAIIIIGASAIYLVTGGLNFKELFKELQIYALIPILFIVVGIISIIKGIKIKHKEKII